MYKALYLKYRPQNFNEVIGQEVVKRILENTIKEEKINHAYLFYGERGTGKTTLARIFAKSLNCPNITKNDPNPCNKCESCIEIDNDKSSNVIEIDAASNNGVDDIRDLIEKMNYLSVDGKKKVYIIDEVHMLSKAAFNSLLKTLEEPPKNVIFILATTEIEKIPETILSRSITLPFSLLSIKDIKLNLKMIVSDNEYTIDQESLENISIVAEGSMRDSISLLETIMIYIEGKNIKNNDVAEVLQIFSNDDMKLLSEGKLNIDNISKYNGRRVILVLLNNLYKSKGNPELINDLSIALAQVSDPIILNKYIISLFKKYQSDEIISSDSLSSIPLKKSEEVEEVMEIQKTEEVKEDKEVIGIVSRETTTINTNEKHVQEIELTLKEEMVKDVLSNNEEPLNKNEDLRQELMDSMKNFDKVEATAESLITEDNNESSDKWKEISLPDDSIFNELKESKNNVLGEGNKKPFIDEITEELMKEEMHDVNTDVSRETHTELEGSTSNMKVDSVEEVKEEIVKNTNILDLVNPKHIIYTMFHNESSNLDEIKEKFKTIWEQYDDLKEKEYVTLLTGSTPLSLTDNILIVGVPDETKYEALKEVTNTKSFLKFIKKICNSPLYLVPVTSENWTKCVKHHTELVNEGKEIDKSEITSLPEIEFSSDKYKDAKSFFGDSFIDNE